VTHDALMEAVAAAGQATWVKSARLFDIYRPASGGGDLRPDERSLSIRLELLDDAVTLTDERIEAVVSDVLATLVAGLGVRLRA
jgi:phenylalanyl-tRNA synthetase beta chain